MQTLQVLFVGSSIPLYVYLVVQSSLWLFFTFGKFPSNRAGPSLAEPQSALEQLLQLGAGPHLPLRLFPGLLSLTKAL